MAETMLARYREETDRLAPATVCRLVSAVSSYYTYLVDEEIVSRSPASRATRPKVAGESTTFGPSKAQVAAMIDAAARSGDRPQRGPHPWQPERDVVLMLLLALNGLRVSEAVGINAGAIKTERGHQVVVVKGKGGRVDKVPLPPRTVEAIDALEFSEPRRVRDRRGVPLLVGHDGRRLSAIAARRIVARLGRWAGIEEHVHPHCLRHTFTTTALGSGVPLHVVQIGCRHTDPSTTMRYFRNAKAPRRCSRLHGRRSGGPGE